MMGFCGMKARAVSGVMGLRGGCYKGVSGAIVFAADVTREVMAVWRLDMFGCT